MKFLITLVSTVWIAIIGTIAAQAETDKPAVIEMSLGMEAAPIEVIEYASFTCPHCKNFNDNIFPKLKSEYIDTGKIKFIYRETYFDRYSVWANMVARCAPQQSFFGVVKEIYSEQENWLPLARANKDLEVVEEFRKIGKLAGLTDPDLDSCLADREMLKELIGWHKTNMETHEISGTPGIVIDGVVTSSTSFEAISKLLDEKLGS